MDVHATRCETEGAGKTNVGAMLAIGVLLALYAGSAALGWPQAASSLAAADAGHANDLERHGSHADSTTHAPPPLIWAAPFALLLGAIAVFPLLHLTEHWWERNANKLYVSLGLAAVTLGYYLFLHAAPVDRHFLSHAEALPAAAGPNFQIAWVVLQNALFHEYVPFIVLLFSLYTISGGVRIEGDLPAHPGTSTAFIAIGALLASFVGTTGAAMLLIRPLLETNKERRHVSHTVVFFIFAVCNCGGCLLPIGDPPLFLGYLNGVPFLWTVSLWKQWLFVNGLLLVVYFVWDRWFAYPHETRKDIALDETQIKPLAFSGLINAVWLAGVIFSVALLDPGKKLLAGTALEIDWRPWLYLREAVQLALVLASLKTTPAAVRTANRFNYGAILEVAALFVGIFICMQPALQYLDAFGSQLGLTSPVQFFWATGALSSVLDNAPTYLVFFETAKALPHAQDAVLVAGVEERLLTAVSLGAVFLGAMTYIGNGPNFMVKAIAESAGVKMPSFFGFVLYSCGVLLPILLVSTWLFV